MMRQQTALLNTVKIIGIDPGTSITGFGIVQKNGNHLAHIESGIIKLKKSLQLSEKLLIIHERILELIDQYKPDALAIEEAFYAKNVRSAMTLAHARGTILLTAAKANLPVYEYSPLEVKRASTGYGRASKEQVFEMIKRLVNLQNDQIQSTDQTDALAVAICHLNTFNLEQKLGASATNLSIQGSHQT